MIINMPYQPSYLCPTCGHCPTCGRGGHQAQPYTQPYTTLGGPTGPFTAGGTVGDSLNGGLGNISGMLVTKKCHVGDQG